MIYLWAYLGAMIFATVITAIFLEETAPAVSITEMIEHGIAAIGIGILWPFVVLCFLLWLFARINGWIFIGSGR